MLNIVYIYHSGFAVTAESVNLVFDYWQDPYPAEDGRPAFLSLLDPSLPTLVFVSHFHKDHFNPEIFSWHDLPGGVDYVISKDVARHARKYLRQGTVYSGPKPSEEQVHVMREEESITLHGVEVNAFGSTDTGLSYLLKLPGGETLFHAGDLNWWAWGDDTPEEAEAARSLFMSKIEPIRRAVGAATGKKVDVMMWPVDPRLGGEYWRGAKLMCSLLRVGVLLPMHFTLAKTERGKEEFIADVARLIATESPFAARETVMLAHPHATMNIRNV